MQHVMLLACLGTIAPLSAMGRLGMTAQTLTQKTFDRFVSKNEKVIVDFINGTDKEWSKLDTELQAAVRKARSLGCEVPISQVDVSKESELAKQFVPNGPFPQLVWFQGGELTQYH